MKNILKVPTFLICIHYVLYLNPAYAVEIKDKNEYLMDARGDDGDIYLNRLSVNKKFDPANMEIFAFGETQWNFDTDKLEKLLLGIGAGMTLYRYLRISQSVQLISGEMLDYLSFSVNTNSIDTTTTIGLYVPFAKYFYFNIAEEYSFNLEECRDEYCETIAEICYRPKDMCSFGIGWRHTDRIHEFDTDYVSSSLTLHF